MLLKNCIRNSRGDLQATCTLDLDLLGNLALNLVSMKCGELSMERRGVFPLFETWYITMADTLNLG